MLSRVSSALANGMRAVRCKSSVRIKIKPTEDYSLDSFDLTDSTAVYEELKLYLDVEKDVENGFVYVDENGVKVETILTTVEVKNEFGGHDMTTSGIKGAINSESSMASIADADMEEAAATSDQDPTLLKPKQLHTTSYHLRCPRSGHTHKRPFVCTMCGKGFLRKYNWKRHEEAHRKKSSMIEGLRQHADINHGEF